MAEFNFLMSIVVEILGLGMVHDENAQYLSPKIGSMLLQNFRECERLDLHTDPDFSPVLDEIVEQPSYFFMISGRTGFIIWVFPRSHCYIALPENVSS